MAIPLKQIPFKSVVDELILVAPAVQLADIRAHEQEIKNCDILLIYTGYCDIREKDPAAFADDFR